METRAQAKAKEVETEESRLAELESRLNRRFSAEIERISASSLHRSSGTIKPSRLIPLQYSWEEVNERREKGLCIFCEENETPDHHLKHKGLGLVFMDVDDQSFDEEVVELSSALLTPKGDDTSSVEKKTETENKEGEVVPDKREPMEVDTSAVEHKTESGGRAEEPPKSAAAKVQVQAIELVVRDQTQEAISDVVSSPRVSVKRVGVVQSQACISGRANHVWKPGGLVYLQSPLSWVERADNMGNMKQSLAGFHRSFEVEAMESNSSVSAVKDVQVTGLSPEKASRPEKETTERNSSVKAIRSSTVNHVGVAELIPEQGMVEIASILAKQPDVVLELEQDMKATFIQKDQMQKYRVVRAHTTATMSLSTNQTDEINETDDNSSPLWHRWKNKPRDALALDEESDSDISLIYLTQHRLQQQKKKKSCKTFMFKYKVTKNVLVHALKTLQLKDQYDTRVPEAKLKVDGIEEDPLLARDKSFGFSLCTTNYFAVWHRWIIKELQGWCLQWLSLTQPRGTTWVYNWLSQHSSFSSTTASLMRSLEKEFKGDRVQSLLLWFLFDDQQEKQPQFPWKPGEFHSLESPVQLEVPMVVFAPWDPGEIFDAADMEQKDELLQAYMAFREIRHESANEKLHCLHFQRQAQAVVIRGDGSREEVATLAKIPVSSLTAKRSIKFEMVLGFAKPEKPIQSGTGYALKITMDIHTRIWDPDTPEVAAVLFLLNLVVKVFSTGRI